MSRTFMRHYLTFKTLQQRLVPSVRFFTVSSRLLNEQGDNNNDDNKIFTPVDWPIQANAPYEIEIPLPPIIRRNENVETMRSRLLYQSRKRGMAENDILISTFAKRFLPGFSLEQLKMYDILINQPSNDWDLYYWMTGASPIPWEYDNEIMAEMVKHTKNAGMEVRLRQADLVPGEMMLGYDSDEDKASK